jgi:cytochrome c biogenesis protein CcmG, thiol:disulfide interchange protein DsbE
MRPVRAVAVVAVAALLGLLVWDVAHQKNKGIAAKVNRGESVAAPSLELPRLGGGKKFDLAAYRGKVVVLNFWASWCNECPLEAKALHNAAARWRGKAVVVGVDTKDLSSDARRYMRHYAVNYEVVRDISGTQGDSWGVTGYPETFIIDRAGDVIPPHVVGPVPAAQLNAAIQNAIRS